jgi:hypothetical protein
MASLHVPGTTLLGVAAACITISRAECKVLVGEGWTGGSATQRCASS